ncbi:hypothetical protein Efla_007882 [Eimeria flavescens]
MMALVRLRYYEQGEDAVSWLPRVRLGGSVRHVLMPFSVWFVEAYAAYAWVLGRRACMFSRDESFIVLLEESESKVECDVVMKLAACGQHSVRDHKLEGDDAILPINEVGVDFPEWISGFLPTKGPARKSMFGKSWRLGQAQCTNHFFLIKLSKGLGPPD